VREALAGLTVRGRALLAAGLTAVACAVFLDQSALARVGVLLVAVPLLTVFVMARSSYRLSLVRTVTPQVVAAGQPARVQLVLVNEGRTPVGVLLLEDQVPYLLGTRPRFVLEGIGHGWRRQVTYHVRSDLRGRFEIGPMSVRATDPFGMVELGRTFHTTAALTVTPRTVPLPDIPIAGAWTGTGDNRPRAFATGSAEDVTVREYRRGDELRRVHWRSSARVGELMVRREEQPWQSRATLFIDNREIAHRGRGASSSLETAVSVAASVAMHLSRRGFTVRLVTAHGEDPGTVWHFRQAAMNTGPLLEELAVLEATSRQTIASDWLADTGHGGLVVGVLGKVDPVDHAVLRRMRHHAGAALALALDVDAWSPGVPPGPGSAPTLIRLGWPAVGVRPGDRLDLAWQDLGRLFGRGARSAGATEEELVR
jgi:uncharacterized protein (DUF58 family)